jgi:Tfp pilus assembly protein PilN
MLITGPAVGRNGLVADMGQMLNIPTVPTDLTRDTENRIDEFPADAWRPHQMNNALALALLEVLGIKGLNFRRGPFAIRKRWAEYKQNITVAAILAGVLVLMMLTNVFLDYRARSQRLEMLDRRITEIFQTTFPEVTRVVDPVQQMRVNIPELKGTSPSVSDSGNQLPAVDILNEISRRIPADVDVQFSRLILADDSVVISGDSDTFNSVDTIKGSLESSDIFQEVTIVSTTKEAKDNRIRFRLRIKL